MKYQCFTVSIEQHVAHVECTRPEQRNAMIPAFWDELPRLIEDIDNNCKARVIVISAQGPHFSSGIDLAAFMSTPKGGKALELNRGEQFYRTAKRMQHTFTALEECRLPVLAAIQGACIGGGVDFATACDIRYATEDAYFTIQETNIGMVADVGTFPRLLNLLAEGIVRELSYTGRAFSAKEAVQHGLVNRLYADQETMLTEVMKIAQAIAAKAPSAVYGCKRMINYSRDHSTADSLDYVVAWNAGQLDMGQIGEALDSAGSKRAPNFRDLPPIRESISD